MSEDFNSQIKNLLADAEDGRPARKETLRLRGRLAANIAEALATPAVKSGPVLDDHAVRAAFLESRLGAAERDAFAAALVQDENLRADMESASALIESVGPALPPVPSHLLQQAVAQLIPSPAPARAEGSSWLRPFGQWSLTRPLWAAAAVAAVLVLVPGAVLVTGDQLGWWPWNEENQMSASPAPEIEPPKSCPDTPEQPGVPAVQQGEKPQSGTEPADVRTPDAASDAPCPPPAGKDSTAGDRLAPDAPKPPAPANP